MAAGSLDPQKVVIPGHVVSAVIRSEVSAMPGDGPSAATRRREWSLAGERRAPQRHVGARGDARARSSPAARCAACPDGAVVNLGAGLADVRHQQAARWEGATPDTLSLLPSNRARSEAGRRSAESQPIPMPSSNLPLVFDYYTGGGIDVSILSFAEIDGDGSVNVSRFGDMMPGCGGFVDITQNATHLVFCGAFAAGGESPSKRVRVEVALPGKVSKFVPRLQQLTFNARARLQSRGVVDIRHRASRVRPQGDGLVLTEVAPGIDVRRDVLDEIPFSVSVDEHLKSMDPALFRAPSRNLHDR